MARRLLSFCCSLAFCFSLVSALDVQGKIAWNSLCPNVTTLGRAKAILDGGKYAGSVTRSGQFTVRNVPEGIYVLSVVSHDYVFPELRIDVLSGSSRPEVRPYVAGTPLNPPSNVLLPHPISLSAREKLSFFSAPESFNLLSMLSNPMMMMMIFAGALMLGMPYMMKNLDPEALQEIKDNQARMAGMQNAFASGDIKGGLSAIMAAADEMQGDAPAPVPGKPAQKPSRGTKKARR